MIKAFPMLYQKTNTGAIQQWSIYVQEMAPDADEPNPYSGIVTVYGQVGGKLQTTADKVREGKNLGKKNETNHYTQAVAEAEAKWTKQKKKGYVESLEDAQAGKVDATVITGGTEPMLAQKYRDHYAKMKWPAYIQPKLNGIRCIAMIENGKASLWSRTRKPFASMPHIVADLEKRFAKYEGTLIFDGELYNHDWSKEFGKERAFDLFEHFVMQKVPIDHRNEAEGETEYSGLWYGDIKYNVYDSINDKQFSDRLNELQSRLEMDDTENFDWESPTVVVQTVAVNEENVMDYFDMFRKDEYEGAMLRNIESPYEGGKRSYNLQKVKALEDGEFKIVGIEEGSGKLQKHVGAFVCEYEGKTFTAKLKGKQEFLKQCFENHSLWQGKMLTVEHQGITAKNKVPLQPRGVRIRETIDA